MIRIINEVDFSRFDNNLGDDKDGFIEGVESISKDEIKGVGALGLPEYEKYKDEIPKLRKRWWLMSPDDEGQRTCRMINEYGGVVKHAYTNCPNVQARPVLFLNTKKYKIGSEFTFGGYVFTVIGKRLAICNDSIGECYFRYWDWDDAPGTRQAYDPKYKDWDKGFNNYEKSDLKKYIEKWFNSAS